MPCLATFVRFLVDDGGSGRLDGVFLHRGGGGRDVLVLDRRHALGGEARLQRRAGLPELVVVAPQVVLGERHAQRDIGLDGSDRAAAPLGFHPDNLSWTAAGHVLAGGQIAGPVELADGVKTGRNAVAIRPGKIDRSPTGTGVSARHAKPDLPPGGLVPAIR